MMVVETTPETGDTIIGIGVGVGVGNKTSDIPAAMVGEMVGHGGHVGTTICCTGETTTGIVGHGGHVGTTICCTGDTKTGNGTGQKQNGKVGIGRLKISRSRSGLIRVGQKQPDDEVTIIYSPPISNRLLTSLLQSSHFMRSPVQTKRARGTDGRDKRLSTPRKPVWDGHWRQASHEAKGGWPRDEAPDAG